ncbi:MAG: hypothetical protein KVP17_003909 [Porospora cf. gigantea B]|uniref:uncharacterized protein n=1 Tax=Porospora cf. gigantea B TaxID=2853592 RepID=UPI003571F22B|nr:MAG: hypothetical protein KVP17_003909 [Porospora cf. gigantea B]
MLSTESLDVIVNANLTSRTQSGLLPRPRPLMVSNKALAVCQLTSRMRSRAYPVEGRKMGWMKATSGWELFLAGMRRAGKDALCIRKGRFSNGNRLKCLFRHMASKGDNMSYGDVYDSVQRLILGLLEGLYEGLSEAGTAPGTPCSDICKDCDPVGQLAFRSYAPTSSLPSDLQEPIHRPSKVRFDPEARLCQTSSDLAADCRRLLAFRAGTSSSDISRLPLKGEISNVVDCRDSYVHHLLEATRAIAIMGGDYPEALVAQLAMGCLRGAVVPLHPTWSATMVCQALAEIVVDIVIVPAARLDLMLSCSSEYVGTVIVVGLPCRDHTRHLRAQGIKVVSFKAMLRLDLEFDTVQRLLMYHTCVLPFNFADVLTAEFSPELSVAAHSSKSSVEAAASLGSVSGLRRSFFKARRLLVRHLGLADMCVRALTFHILYFGGQLCFATDSSVDVSNDGWDDIQCVKGLIETCDRSNPTVCIATATELETLVTLASFVGSKPPLQHSKRSFLDLGFLKGGILCGVRTLVCTGDSPAFELLNQARVLLGCEVVLLPRVPHCLPFLASSPQGTNPLPGSLVQLHCCAALKFPQKSGNVVAGSLLLAGRAAPLGLWRAADRFEGNLFKTRHPVVFEVSPPGPVRAYTGASSPAHGLLVAQLRSSSLIGDARVVEVAPDTISVAVVPSLLGLVCWTRTSAELYMDLRMNLPLMVAADLTVLDVPKQHTNALLGRIHNDTQQTSWPSLFYRAVRQDAQRIVQGLGLVLEKLVVVSASTFDSHFEVVRRLQRSSNTNHVSVK